MTALPHEPTLPSEPGLAPDHVPTAGARAGELRAYGRMVRMLGRPVAQPDVSTRAPVLLVPGFLSGDVSLTLLARELRRAGLRTFRSDIGANVGCTEEMVERLVRRVEVVTGDEGRPVVLVGHSRGGMITALAARRRPDLVAGLVTLAAPITGSLSVAPHVRKQLELLFRLHERGLHRVLAADCVTGACATRVITELGTPFPSDVPFTSVYSRNDAILDWRTCLDPAADLVEVAAGHVGMTTDPQALRAVTRTVAATAAPGS
ncbi:esterase/lipase family protein [uncultured Jatrophihabitans sp.]|uniref:esterase/lipase family protein n=1 Tax=uncultured Jatrophihabitans sp. TaxID=1610747 RepID=UPI0035CB49C4